MAYGDSRKRSVGLTGVVVSAAVLLAVLAAIYAWTSAARASAVQGHHYYIHMTDYAFSPAHMTWIVGEKVTVTLINDSGSHPPKAHEWMLGQHPNTEEGAFGQKVAEGFQNPFFKGVTINIDGGGGLQMMGAGPAKFSGKKPMTLLTKKARNSMNMEKMAGFMPLLGGKGRVTFSFTVPDKPGTWTYGCFQQSGQHFLNGMRGTVDVRKG